MEAALGKLTPRKSRYCMEMIDNLSSEEELRQSKPQKHPDLKKDKAKSLYTKGKLKTASLGTIQGIGGRKCSEVQGKRRTSKGDKARRFANPKSKENCIVSREVSGDAVRLHSGANICDESNLCSVAVAGKFTGCVDVIDISGPDYAENIDVRTSTSPNRPKAMSIQPEVHLLTDKELHALGLFPDRDEPMTPPGQHDTSGPSRIPVPPLWLPLEPHASTSERQPGHQVSTFDRISIICGSNEELLAVQEVNDRLKAEESCTFLTPRKDTAPRTPTSQKLCRTERPVSVQICSEATKLAFSPSPGTNDREAQHDCGVIQLEASQSLLSPNLSQLLTFTSPLTGVPSPHFPPSKKYLEVASHKCKRLRRLEDKKHQKDVPVIVSDESDSSNHSAFSSGDDFVGSVGHVIQTRNFSVQKLHASNCTPTFREKSGRKRSRAHISSFFETQADVTDASSDEAEDHEDESDCGGMGSFIDDSTQRSPICPTPQRIGQLKAHSKRPREPMRAIYAQSLLSQMPRVSQTRTEGQGRCKGVLGKAQTMGMPLIGSLLR